MAREMASTMVVIKGDAITAGSKPSFFAAMGSVQPMTLAQNTVHTRVIQITRATMGVRAVLPSSSRSTSIILTKLARARTTPQSTATRISFQTTFSRSENSISFRLRPRITVTDAWEPQLPPVSMSMGMKPVSTTQALRASSKEEMMIPVKVADTISSRSQGIRAAKVESTLVRR